MSALLISGGLQAAGMLIGGIAAKNTAELNAFNIQTERKMGEAEAIQRNNARVEQYESNMSANIASFYAAGRDVGADRSVKAFLERQKEVAGKDLQVSDTMAYMDALKATAQAAAVRSEGKAQMMSATLDAFTSVASTMHKYNQVKVP